VSFVVVCPVLEHSQVDSWRLLDLSGISNSVRDSRDMVLAGMVTINGSPVRSLKHRSMTGEQITMEVTFQSGRVVSKTFVPVPYVQASRQINRGF